MSQKKDELAQTPVRGLPMPRTDGNFVKDSYVWDRNGNLIGPTDTRNPVLQGSIPLKRCHSKVETDVPANAV